MDDMGVVLDSNWVLLSLREVIWDRLGLNWYKMQSTLIMSIILNQSNEDAIKHSGRLNWTSTQLWIHIISICSFSALPQAHFQFLSVHFWVLSKGNSLERLQERKGMYFLVELINYSQLESETRIQQIEQQRVKPKITRRMPFSARQFLTHGSLFPECSFFPFFIKH